MNNEKAKNVKQGCKKLRGSQYENHKVQQIYACFRNS